MAQKQSALILSLGGAPENWHTVDGLPGLYHPLIAVPLPDSLTVEDAKNHDKDPGHPLAVVLVSDAKLDEGRAAQQQALQSLRGRRPEQEGLSAVHPESLEGQRAQDNDEAAAGASGEEA